jgi:hypothetical protein
MTQDIRKPSRLIRPSRGSQRGHQVPDPEGALVGENLGLDGHPFERPEHHDDGPQAALPGRLDQLRVEVRQTNGIRRPHRLHHLRVKILAPWIVARGRSRGQPVRQVAAGDDRHPLAQPLAGGPHRLSEGIQGRVWQRGHTHRHQPRGNAGRLKEVQRHGLPVVQRLGVVAPAGGGDAGPAPVSGCPVAVGAAPVAVGARRLLVQRKRHDPADAGLGGNGPGQFGVTIPRLLGPCRPKGGQVAAEGGCGVDGHGISEIAPVRSDYHQRTGSGVAHALRQFGHGPRRPRDLERVRAAHGRDDHGRMRHHSRHHDALGRHTRHLPPVNSFRT